MTGPALLLEETLRFSVDGEGWFSASADHRVPDEFLGTIESVELTPEWVAVVQAQLDKDDFEEPLARQVLLEAGNLVETNPRAAWVLAVAAAEIGVKQFGSARGSVSESWLITTLPSPPLSALLAHYVPLIVAATSHVDRPPLPKPLRKLLVEAAETRNEIVHKGIDAPSPDDLIELLGVVNQLLYYLDWVGGHDWAAAHLPTGVRQV
jgi:hypothetical protein